MTRARVWWLRIVVVGLLAACACSRGVRPEATAPDAVTPTDAGPDAHDARSDADTRPACPSEPGARERADRVLLEIEAPSRPPIGSPFVIGVRTRTGAPLSEAVELCGDGLALGSLQLYRGRGSLSVTLERAGMLSLEAASASGYGQKQVQLVPRMRVSPQLAEDAGELVWSADQDIVVAGDLQLGAGTRLVIEAGTRVLLERNATIELAGSLVVRGTREAPVLFTRAGEASWGGLRLLPGSSAEISEAWFIGAGGDAERRFGHSRSQPVIWVEQASLAMTGGGVVDNPGKAFGSQAARVALDGVLVSRCDTGGEFTGTQLQIRGGHVLEIPDADSRNDDDDNDGIYVSGAAQDDAGVDLESTIEDTVFANGEDDGIDHNNGLLRIERVWIEGFAHEGVACSKGRRVRLVDSVVRRCEQGVEAGYGNPEVFIEHSLLTNNGVGLRFGDSYDWSTSGTLSVYGSIIAGNQEADVRNHVVELAGPLPDAIQIRCSVVGDSSFSGRDGNLGTERLVLDGDGHCASAPSLEQAMCESRVPGPSSCL